MIEPESFLREAPLAAPSERHEDAMASLFAAAELKAARRRAVSPLAAVLYLAFGAAAACLTLLASRGTAARAAVVYQFQATPAIESMLLDTPSQPKDLPILHFESEPERAPNP